MICPSFAGDPYRSCTNFLPPPRQALNARSLTSPKNTFIFRRFCSHVLQIDPGTFTTESLRGYQQLGITRFSVGVQAFQQVASHHTQLLL